MFKRRKLNSIWFGPTILALIGILTIAAPLAIYLGDRALGLFGINTGSLLVAIPISITAGIGLMVLFGLLLVIEFIQDRFLDLQYRKTRKRKVKISESSYECQYCGCQKVRTTDGCCPVCGQDLID